MSKKDFTISMEVLSSLAPKKGMLNASESDLMGTDGASGTFELHSLVPGDKRKTNLSTAHEDNMYVKARYINKTTKRSFLVPIRGLLNMSLVQLGSENATFTEDTPAMKVHEYLMEVIGDGSKPAALPETFTIVSVKDRVQQGTDNIMYPPYCYDAFNDRVKALRDADKDASLDEVYNDFEFMTGLYATERSARHQNAGANKDIVISI